VAEEALWNKWLRPRIGDTPLAAFTWRTLAEVLLQIVDNQHFPKEIHSCADFVISSKRAYTRKNYCNEGGWHE